MVSLFYFQRGKYMDKLNKMMLELRLHMNRLQPVLSLAIVNELSAGGYSVSCGIGGKSACNKHIYKELPTLEAVYNYIDLLEKEYPSQITPPVVIYIDYGKE